MAATKAGRTNRSPDIDALSCPRLHERMLDKYQTLQLLEESSADRPNPSSPLFFDSDPEGEFEGTPRLQWLTPNTPWFVFEGPDGAGKTSLMQAVMVGLTDAGMTVGSTYAPGGAGVEGPALRQFLLRTPTTTPMSRLAVLQGFATDHLLQMEHLTQFWADNHATVSDRWMYLSSQAYQRGTYLRLLKLAYDSGGDDYTIGRIAQALCEHVRPTAIIQVNVDLEVSLKRRPLNPGVTFEARAQDRAEQCEIYRALPLQTISEFPENFLHLDWPDVSNLDCASPIDALSEELLRQRRQTVYLTVEGHERNAEERERMAQNIADFLVRLAAIVTIPDVAEAPATGGSVQ